MRTILPLFLTIVAIGLFVLYTNPTYQEAKALRAQAAAYDEALNRSQELRAMRDKLLAKRNTFSAGDVQKLERMLPDNVDNIRLIIDINNIATRRNLSLSEVSLGTVRSGRTEGSVTAVGVSGDPVGSVTVGFAVSAAYEDFLLFLADLEHSLRLVDVEKISFSAASDDISRYVLSIRTYWLQ